MIDHGLFVITKTMKWIEKKTIKLNYETHFTYSKKNYTK